MTTVGRSLSRCPPETRGVLSTHEVVVPDDRKEGDRFPEGGTAYKPFTGLSEVIGR